MVQNSKSEPKNFHSCVPLRGLHEILKVGTPPDGVLHAWALSTQGPKSGHPLQEVLKGPQSGHPQRS
jgi:hypothetical protein